MVRTLSFVVFEVSGVDIHAPGLGRAGDPHEMNGKDVADFFKADGTGIFLPVREVGMQMECQRMEDHRGEHHGLEVMEPAFVLESAAQLAGLRESAELDVTRRRAIARDGWMRHGQHGVKDAPEECRGGGAPALANGRAAHGWAGEGA